MSVNRKSVHFLKSYSDSEGLSDLPKITYTWCTRNKIRTQDSWLPTTPAYVTKYMSSSHCNMTHQTRSLTVYPWHKTQVLISTFKTLDDYWRKWDRGKSYFSLLLNQLLQKVILLSRLPRKKVFGLGTSKQKSVKFPRFNWACINVSINKDSCSNFILGTSSPSFKFRPLNGLSDWRCSLWFHRSFSGTSALILCSVQCRKH